jgi:hypothetical protein
LFDRPWLTATLSCLFKDDHDCDPKEICVSRGETLAACAGRAAGTVTRF